MNRYNILFIIALLSLVFSSCKNEVEQIVGNYSYKLSGTTIVTDEDGIQTETNLSDEIGTLDITEKNGQLEFIFNQTGGSVYRTTASVSNSTISVQTFSRTLTAKVKRTIELPESKSDNSSGIDIDELRDYFEDWISDYFDNPFFAPADIKVDEDNRTVTYYQSIDFSTTFSGNGETTDDIITLSFTAEGEALDADIKVECPNLLFVAKLNK